MTDVPDHIVVHQLQDKIELLEDYLEERTTERDSLKWSNRRLSIALRVNTVIGIVLAIWLIKLGSGL